jgi:hypothetical protein
VGAGPSGVGLVVSQVSDARPALRRETGGHPSFGMDLGPRGGLSRSQKTIKNAKNRNGFWRDLLMINELRPVLYFLVRKSLLCYFGGGRACVVNGFRLNLLGRGPCNDQFEIRRTTFGQRTQLPGLSLCLPFEYALEVGNDRQSCVRKFLECFHGVGKERDRRGLDIKAGTEGTRERGAKGSREHGSEGKGIKRLGRFFVREHGFVQSHPFAVKPRKGWGNNFPGIGKIWSPSAPGSGASDSYSEAEARRGRFHA